MELKQYMVDLDLPPVLSEEFISMIPQQRAIINTMMNEGNITSYTLALDRSKLWATFIAESEADVEAMLDEWPLIGHMTYEIHELFFHEMATNALPAISLN